VNDTVQEVGGALGVAVLGSVLTAAYGAALAPSVHTLPAPLAAAARNSIGAAVTIAHHLGGNAGHGLLLAARAAFVQAMSATVLVAVVIALAGVAVALLFLPSRPGAVAAPSGATAPQPQRVTPPASSR
jgi:DHA2 family integral membrane protein (MFS transporter)